VECLSVKHAKSGHGGPVPVKCSSINDHKIPLILLCSSSSSSNSRGSSQQNTKNLPLHLRNTIKQSVGGPSDNSGAS